MARRDEERLVLAATARMVEAARARLLAAAQGATVGARIGFEEAAPGFTAALAALPDLRPLLGLAPELRGPVLLALENAGAVVPEVTWSHLGVRALFDRRRYEDAAATWSLCASERDVEGAGCFVDGDVVLWPSVFELPRMPRELRTVVRAGGDGQ